VPLTDLLRPGLRAVIVGTIAAWDRDALEHYYATPGNAFYLLVYESGLVPVRLEREDDHRLPDYGIGLTDLVRTEPSPPGEPPRFDVDGLHRTLRRARPVVVAFVSKTAATSYARAARQRAPRGYGELSWTVAGRPAFVLPGPSGANNGMPLPLRIALWRDLADFLESLGAAPPPLT
jgi:TDG/mug DNA glycosylase family protein